MADRAFFARNGLVVNTSLLVANNGRVGVNTAAPAITLHIAANDAVLMPRGNTAERPGTGANGMIRYNTDSNALEAFTGGVWNDISANTANVVSIGLSYDGGSDTLSVSANNFQSAYLRSNFGNSTANIVITNTQISVGNSTATANLDPSKLLIGTSVVNSTMLASGANVLANTTTLFVGNSTVNVVVNSSQISVGNVALTPTDIKVGNSTANIFSNSILIKVANSTGISNLQPGQLVIGTSTVNTSALSVDFGVLSTGLTVGNSTVNVVTNSSQVSVGANIFFDSTKLSIGNSTANLIANSIIMKVASAAGIANLQPTQLVIGTSVVNASSLILGTNVVLDTTHLFVGNSTANLNSNSILISLANSTFTANIDPSKIVIGLMTVNSTAHIAGSNVFLDTTRLSIGNTTQNVVVNSTGFYLNAVAYTPTATGGVNTQVLFNDSGSSNGISSFTFDKTTNVAYLANSLTIGANVVLDTTKVLVGNSTANLLSNSILISIANSTGMANLQPTQLLIGTSTVNSTAILSGLGVISTLLTVGNSTVNVVSNSTQVSVGSNIFFDTTKLSIGNSTANIFANSILFKVANASGIANLQPTQLVIGTSTVNATAFLTGANVFLDTISLSIGNSTANLFANSILIKIANSSGTANLQPTQLVIGGSLVNTSAIAVGNVVVNTSAISVGNSTVNVTTNSSSLTLGPCLLVAVNSSYVVTTLPNTQIIDSFALATYLSAKYTLTLKDNNSSNVQISDILVVQGSSGQTGISEMNMISNTSANLGVFTLTSNATHALLNFVMASNNITFKGMKIYTG